MKKSDSDESGDSVHSGDSGESVEFGESGDSRELGDSGECCDSGKCGDSGESVVSSKDGGSREGNWRECISGIIIIKVQASADVTPEEQIWMRKQGKRLKKLRGDVSFFRFPLKPTPDQVIILVQPTPIFTLI